jgi:hypothetical protein
MKFFQGLHFHAVLDPGQRLSIDQNLAPQCLGAQSGREIGDIPDGAIIDAAFETDIPQGRVACGQSNAKVEIVAFLEPALAQLFDTSLHLDRHPDRPDSTCHERTLPLEVERVGARFGAWYELFPRSFGGFEGVRKRLPKLAELGFDVLYLPPIHPIGETARKGKDNFPDAEIDDVGSPWAIGSAQGGHKSVHPDLGTVDDVTRLAEAWRGAGFVRARRYEAWDNGRPPAVDGT